MDVANGWVKFVTKLVGYPESLERDLVCRDTLARHDTRLSAMGRWAVVVDPKIDDLVALVAETYLLLDKVHDCHDSKGSRGLVEGYCTTEVDVHYGGMGDCLVLKVGSCSADSEGRREN